LKSAEDQIWRSKQEARYVADQLETYETAKAKRDAEKRLNNRSKSEKQLPVHDPVEYSTQVRQAAQGVTAEARALLPHLQQKVPPQQPPSRSQRSPTNLGYPKVDLPRSPFEEEPLPREPTQPPAMSSQRMPAPPPVTLGSASSPSRLQPPMQRPAPAPLDRFGTLGSEPPSPGSLSNQRPISPMFQAQDSSPSVYQRPVSPMMQVRPVSPMGSSAPQLRYAAPQAAARATSPMTRSMGHSPVQNVNMYSRPAPSVQFTRPQAPQVVPGYQTYATGSAPTFAFSPDRYAQPGHVAPPVQVQAPSEAVFNAMDRNGDGMITRAEWNRAMGGGAPPSPMMMSRGSVGSPGPAAGNDGEVLEQWWCVRRPGLNGQATVTPMSQSPGPAAPAA